MLNVVKTLTEFSTKEEALHHLSSFTARELKLICKYLSIPYDNITTAKIKIINATTGARLTSDVYKNSKW